MDLVSVAPSVLITLLSLVVYIATIVNVGRARHKFNVPVPQITGNPDFERVFRVQQNTLENMIIFLPGLWIFTVVVNSEWAAILGSLWLVARIIYAIGYSQSVPKRAFGFIFSMLVNVVLVISSFVGVLMELVK
ncbi:MAG: MAPEG family protein [Candidatus Caenarcaniphilales bacterium]|nr:MAPEG family protein [Candidatus Caenarcaniphilales bacterium]